MKVLDKWTISAYEKAIRMPSQTKLHIFNILNSDIKN